MQFHRLPMLKLVTVWGRLSSGFPDCFFFRAVTYGAVFDYLKKGGTVHFDQHRHLWGTCFGAPIYNPPQRSCRGESFCPRGLTATSEKGQNHEKQICFVPHRVL